VDLRRRGEADDLEHGGRHVHQPDAARDAPPRALPAREADDERDPDRRVVEEDAVGVLAVLAEGLAVIARRHDERAVEVPPLPQPREEAGDGCVHRGDFAVVGLPREALGEGRRRVVGVVSVEEMDPEEDGAPWTAVEPRERPRDHVSTPSLLRGIGIGPVPPPPEARIVRVEAAVESRGDRSLRVENDGSQERGGPASPAWSSAGSQDAGRRGIPVPDREKAGVCRPDRCETVERGLREGLLEDDASRASASRPAQPRVDPRNPCGRRALCRG
jgi:hypothetical protein